MLYAWPSCTDSPIVMARKRLQLRWILSTEPCSSDHWVQYSSPQIFYSGQGVFLLYEQSKLIGCPTFPICHPIFLPIYDIINPALGDVDLQEFGEASRDDVRWMWNIVGMHIWVFHFSPFSPNLVAPKICQYLQYTNNFPSFQSFPNPFPLPTFNFHYTKDFQEKQKGNWTN